MSAPLLVLSSTNRNFPLSLERELKDRSFHRLGGLDEFIASPLRAQPFLLILEIGMAEDIERALIACEWAESVQPLGTGRYLLLVAKNVSLGDRAARFRGAEIAYFPLNARNLNFKLDLQLKLLAGAPAVSAAAREASSGFFGELAALPGRPERVMVLRGPSPKRGAWRPTENQGPGGKVRWRWVESVETPKPDDSLKMRWEAESRSAPVYEEKQKAWVLDDPAADVKCLAKDKEIYSVRKEIARETEKARFTGTETPKPGAAPIAFSGGERPESGAAPVSSGGARPVSSSGPHDLTAPAAPKVGAGPGTDALKIERTAPAAEKTQQIFSRGEKAADAPVQAPKELGEADAGAVSSAAARSTERNAGDRNEYQVSRDPAAHRELGDLRGAAAGLAAPNAAATKAAKGAPALTDEETKTLPTLERAAPEAYGTHPEPKVRPETGTPVSAFSGNRIAPDPKRDGKVGDLTNSADASRSETTGKILYNHDIAPATSEARTKPELTVGESGKTVAAPAPAASAAPALTPEPKRADAEAVPSFSSSRASAGSAPLDLTGTRATPAATVETPAAHLTKPAPAKPGEELVARQARPAVTQGTDLTVRRDGPSDSGSVSFEGSGPQNTGANDVTRFKAGPQGEDTARVSAGPRAATEEQNVIGGAKLRNEDDASVKQRLSFVLTCAELGDRNSAWHPAGAHRIYLSAHHRYRGYSSLSELLPLWVYEGELPPEFLESALAWRFFDRMPQRFDSLAALPPGLTAELLRPGGLADGDPSADGKSRAVLTAGPETVVSPAGGAAVGGRAADRPNGPWWRSVWSLFRGIFGR